MGEERGGEGRKGRRETYQEVQETHPFADQCRETHRTEHSSRCHYRSKAPAVLPFKKTKRQKNKKKEKIRKEKRKKERKKEVSHKFLYCLCLSYPFSQEVIFWNGVPVRREQRVKGVALSIVYKELSAATKPI